MKAIAILWNSMSQYFESAEKDIKKHALINDRLTVNLNNHFCEFISMIYPYEGKERWKLDYKINAMNNRYGKNEIMILYLDIAADKMIYVEKKSKFKYESVESLKKYIREKYKRRIQNYTYDIIIHMTDDLNEYYYTLNSIKQFFLKIVNEIKRTRTIELSNYLRHFEKMPTNTVGGKRKKIWFCDNSFLFKYEKFFGIYGEIFTSELAKRLKIDTSVCLPAIYNGKYGLVTSSFLNQNEFFVDGSHMIDAFICKTNRQQTDLLLNPMMEICKYNNIYDLPEIIFYYCNKNNFMYDVNISEILYRLFVFDIILLQSDRNPNNWGIIIGKSHKIRLSPIFDNANCLSSNRTYFSKSKNTLVDFYKEPTLLLYKRNDNIFEDKMKLIKRINDIRIKKIFVEFITLLSDLDFDTVFNDIESLYYIKFPIVFKKNIKIFLKQHIENIKYTIS